MRDKKEIKKKKNRSKMKKNTKIKMNWPLVLLLVTSAFVPMGQVMASNVADTMFFEFNENTRELRVWSKMEPNTYAAFDPTQSDFAMWFHNVTKEKLFGDYINSSILPEWQSREVEVFTDIDSKFFDSAECSKLVFFLDDNTVRRDVRFATVVSVIHKIDIPESIVADTVTESHQDKAFDLKEWKMPIIIAGAALSLLIVILLIIFSVRKRNKRKKEEIVEQKRKVEGIEVVEEVEKEEVRGLDFVCQNSASYYEVDLRKDFAETAVGKVFIHYTVVKKMYDFFTHSLESGDVTKETGCYFVGCWEYDKGNSENYNVSLEEIVEPGDDLEPGEFSFNFGLKIGVKLNSTIEKLSKSTGRDYVHTVWMHSHPGLGLFLSSHDLLVQRQLAYSDAKNRLVAFVVDTNTPNLEMAIFSSKHDGTMNNKEDLHRLYSLEKMYDWSRKAHSSESKVHNAIEEAVVPLPVNLDNYHAIQFNHQGNSRTLNIYLGSGVINAMDDLLYDFDGKHQVAGFLVGTMDSRGNIVVNECKPLSDGQEVPSDSLGLFVVDDERNYSVLEKKYLVVTKTRCVFVGRDGDELLIFTRMSHDQPFPSMDDAATCSMKPMKEWLRRKRIYK